MEQNPPQEVIEKEATKNTEPVKDKTPEPKEVKEELKEEPVLSERKKDEVKDTKIEREH